MQISIVILLFSDQISGRGESFQGGKLPQGGALLWKKVRKETSVNSVHEGTDQLSEKIFIFNSYESSRNPSLTRGHYNKGLT